MASSSLALRRLLSSSVVPRSLRAVRPAATSSRLFNTNAVRNYEDGDERNHRSNRHVSRRGGDFFSDMLEPFTPTRSLSQMLNFMDQVSEFPLASAATRGMGASGVRRGWDVKEKDDALHLRIDMPGLSKEDVKLALEQNTLVIKGEGKTEEGDGDVSGDDGRRFTSRIGLPEKVYKTDEIKAEMKNGVLKVMIPKIKEDERNNVRHINVD
ncbi:PREDICTED: 23.5 kDa heat shock protein, mitochondrial [Camelina sativa]|uniref:23.5 kDa heat shock protein, mitochondrial n=1 Tax=Camelina sativa TaxID=90675 RepID=A0ABM0UKW2_CAMSA|nr:PREDICTED: 23.5 kDa heat shock protein, mitochondrial [Camelina sativa]